ncbi:L,D-transpeptidase family protein [Arundinibacter roseus]|uniref:L,D-transpeptidase n=1 Tax=Arundinibacter roseus TaxID=2070510 RepID=A0A4R4KIU9_9BACT|nr:L,D-transpeptidase family protein [Arundinibacter roseus]TDB68180.1 L,D-transpeptidase [Arundinibacter roseus]
MLNTPLYKGVLFLLLFAILPYSCRQKDYFSMTEAELMTEIQKKNTFDSLVVYGQTIGLRADSAFYRKEGLLRYLEEIGYGQMPANIEHIQKKLSPDSARIWEAAWKIAEGTSMAEALENLEPNYPAYQSLKKHYARLSQNGQSDSAAKVAETLNTYRWIHRQTQGAERWALVNINGAYLSAFDSLGNLQFQMNVIVGKANSPTPGIDTYATNVITYPYWNVPESIALEEMLPKIQENRYYLERNGIEVIDAKGQVVDEFSIEWADITAENFKYRFRQETGEDNSLGVMKVNIENPLAIYLHDTNVRTLFEAKQRWRSHGCIRLQNPVQFANFLANKELLPADFIEKAIKTPDEEHKPTTHALEKRVPVFIFHLTADADSLGRLIYFEEAKEVAAANP